MKPSDTRMTEQVAEAAAETQKTQMTFPPN